MAPRRQADMPISPFVFFFQAEDGIRDYKVTGVTCALPIYVTLGTLAGVIGIPYSLVVGNVRLLYRVVVRGIVPWGVRAAGIRITVSGRENVPAGASCIYLSNHVSNLDPPVLFPVLPGQCSALLKKELMRIPLLGTAMRMAKFVPVGRGNVREAAQASVAAAAAALRSGLHI